MTSMTNKDVYDSICIGRDAYVAMGDCSLALGFACKVEIDLFVGCDPREPCFWHPIG